MIEIATYAGSQLSEAHAHQIRSFIRLHWYDGYAYDLDEPLVPPERRPRHVVAVDRHALFAHARVSTVPFPHKGRTWRLSCLGDVFTYPAFRRQGLGGAVTETATRLIASDPDADLAILFCDPEHAGFYARHGWLPAPALRATKGIGADREPQPGLPMLLLVSEAARTERPDRSGAPWDLPGYGW